MTRFKQVFYGLLFLSLVQVFFGWVPPVQAQTFWQSEVKSTNTTSFTDTPTPLFSQELTITTPQGEKKIPFGNEYQPLSADQLLEAGTPIVVTLQVTETDSGPTENWVVHDVYRLTPLLFLYGLFVLSVIALSGWQGARSLLGLLFSIGVLAWGVIPLLLQGYDPLLISLAAGALITGTTVYLSHGWNLHSHVAWISILLVLVVVGLLAYGSVISFHLTGRATEEAMFLQFLGGNAIQLQGLLLGGILLGTIGVLDDITVSQVAIVTELAEANPELSSLELIRRGLTVGKAHVSSLVNTLVLAYAGANLPLFLLLGQSQQPLWVTINSELLMEEIVRTLVGSIGLVIAVPVSTVLAAVSLTVLPQLKKETSHSHSH